MPRMRNAFYGISYFLGLPWIFRLLHKKQLTILLYHGVAPPADDGIYNYRGKFISPSAFERQMRYVSSRYCVLPLEEAVERLYAGTLPSYALAVTFDDGYRNNYEYAFPLLKKYGVPATVFLATDFVFGGMPLWVDRLEVAMGAMTGTRRERMARDAAVRQELKEMPDEAREERLREIERTSGVSFRDFSEERTVYAPLAREEIRAMQAHGVAFGAHTKSHPILARVSPGRARAEIRGSLDAVRRACGAPSRIFAYPNGNSGDWSDYTEDVLAEAGFVGALTTLEGSNSCVTPPMRLRRIAMDGTGPYSFAAVASGMRIYARYILYGR